MRREVPTIEAILDSLSEVTNVADLIIDAEGDHPCLPEGISALRDTLEVDPVRR